ncbi:hypothetical protein AAFC00_004301 [Neodothiora populina]|uniref:Rab-GAP TBC domain-containing protein n=1 Tax=Neodothiora populina TaxID=2781224 RepID=A0ABR3PJG8_9PEZI
MDNQTVEFPLPTPSLSGHAASDSLVSVPLSDSVRFSVTTSQAREPDSPTAHQDEEDEEYMASLLARLEMENNALATDPKNAAVRSVSMSTQSPARDTDTSSIHPSLHVPPEALGMSLGDFWSSVVRDYPEALASMPTLTPIMIRKGVPDFLRPVVWGSLVGARDLDLCSEFQLLLERLEVEHSSIDGIIDKDLGRCFPTHELFMHPSGEGQRMLGQVLKCYNLHDPEIGYCQGMGFVVGILLMKMEAQDAFCVFVRLMETHGLRNCYSKSLSGLHLRIYQFQQLLAPLSPNLLAHFKNLGVEFAYLSQWFMTIFATTCPLDTLFRIYDVVLAEGADETIMRVALALILKNENKLLDMTEIEDVLQLLLGRGIWDPYEGGADQLVEEVTSLFGQVVTRTVLDKLHKSFLRESEGPAAEKTARALGFGSLHGSAFRLFDNWWAPSKSTSLSPAGFLRRTTSKQSLSTLNSLSGGSGADSLASTDSYASTAPTEVERNPERDSATPTKMHRSVRQEDRSLHEQVEGLLMALSEVQREAAQTAADLQKEQEKRDKAQNIVVDLMKLFHQKNTVDAYTHQRRITLPSRITAEQSSAERKEFRRRSNFVKSVTKSIMAGSDPALDNNLGLQASLLKLCALFDEEQSMSQTRIAAFTKDAPMSDEASTEAQILQLEDELAALRQKMHNDRARRDSKRSADSKGLRSSTDPIDNSSEPIRTRRDLYSRQGSVRDTSPVTLRAPGPLSISVPRMRPHHANSFPQNSSPVSRSASPRPRMIKTQDGRETPAPQKFTKRTSSLVSRNILATPDQQTPPDETLLVELVAAKTREATAIQERDEMKVQLDKMRRMQEAREHELQGQLESVQAIMAAQMEAHMVELERLKSFYAAVGGAISPGTAGSLGPSPAPTHEPVASAAGQSKGWGWFGKGRTASTLSTMSTTSNGGGAGTATS